jgi:hypothetical protein
MHGKLKNCSHYTQKLKGVLVPPPGRPRIIDATRLAELKKMELTRSEQQRSFTTSELKAEITEAVGRTLEARGKNPHGAKTPCRPVLAEIMANVASVVVAKPGTQNQRRMEVCKQALEQELLSNSNPVEVAIDPRTALSMAVIVKAVLSKENGDAVPDCILNSDATSILLEDITEPIRVSAESQKLLKKEAKTPAATKEERQRRGTSLLFTTSAAGRLIATVVMIKDNSFEKFEIVTV